ncbi:hypothetical protein GCM10010210_29030 [Pseudonocardia hydrocarbonoxydans]|uniref:Uncharacterized protein n=1 Tax=Pseudonocardia hydrocarbonoxydans TaxID=76726 RepID=A0A4Y3WKR5_9PSEU|nr:hypothetical protein [Pseudonocardia hydrocarbonoxydans]GEC18610.1 hypothetical protein PHY01_08930 [Pseudonocardia hydrocarbonoxydans]
MTVDPRCSSPEVPPQPWPPAPVSWPVASRVDGDQQRRKVDAVGGEQGRVELGDQLPEVFLQLAGLGGEELVALGECPQRAQHDPGGTGVGVGPGARQGVDQAGSGEPAVVLADRDGCGDQ